MKRDKGRGLKDKGGDRGGRSAVDVGRKNAVVVFVDVIHRHYRERNGKLTCSCLEKSRDRRLGEKP